MTIEVHKPVPDFSATATTGELKLSDFQGQYLVLYFYPRDNTPGCTTEAQDFTAQYEQFKKLNAAIVGVSRDSLKKHENFIAKYDIPYPLIADEDESLCELFGVMKLKKLYGKESRGIERSTFLIDPKGQLVAEWRGLKVPGHVENVLETLRNQA
ncbi:peroxiredoxin [Brackiella oedipodis]|uniref:peroxiredoxin n=1 Tax=Brackiella oedipodis TaxID=124225 RepID=UPI0004919ABE|nr:peroxiredoxin [Brackiella oedipodis]